MNYGEKGLLTELRDRVKMTFEDSCSLMQVSLLLKWTFLNEQWPSKAGDCLIQGTANISLTVQKFMDFDVYIVIHFFFHFMKTLRELAVIRIYI